MFSFYSFEKTLDNSLLIGPYKRSAKSAVSYVQMQTNENANATKIGDIIFTTFYSYVSSSKVINYKLI